MASARPGQAGLSRISDSSATADSSCLPRSESSCVWSAWYCTRYLYVGYEDTSRRDSSSARCFAAVDAVVSPFLRATLSASMYVSMALRSASGARSDVGLRSANATYTASAASR